MGVKIPFNSSGLEPVAGFKQVRRHRPQHDIGAGQHCRTEPDRSVMIIDHGVAEAIDHVEERVEMAYFKEQVR